MSEIVDFNAFKKKKEEAGKNEEENQDYEKKYGLARIDPDKLELMIEIGNSSYRINQSTKATAEKHFSSFTEDELVNFINNSNTLELKAKPTYFIVAFGRLKNMFLRKSKDE